MNQHTYRIRSKVWLYSGQAAWHFASVPEKKAQELRKKYAHKQRGWSSLRVEATVGKTSWRTSIFYDKHSGTFLLPLKAAVRKAEQIAYDDVITVTIKIL